MKRTKLALIAFILYGTIFLDFFVIAGMLFFPMLWYAWNNRIPRSIKVRFL